MPAKLDQNISMLEMPGWDDYALLDSGDGRKLEKYGEVVVDRPDAQAMWRKTDPRRWDAAVAVFDAGKDEEGAGRWKRAPSTVDQWEMRHGDARCICRFSAFRHVGIFPEQSAHWRWFEQRINAANRPLKVLNLFGYTGMASLIAAAAGAHVTHVDASKKAIAWARENQSLSGLEEKPIRWICDDAEKFVSREIRRGNNYDGIILDPPKYGRGPKGEVWQIMDDLPEFLSNCARLLSPKADFMILTAYAIRASFQMGHEMMRDVLEQRPGTLTSGELLLVQHDQSRVVERRLSTSLFSRWEAA